MARKKLTEFKAKQLIIGDSYTGVSINLNKHSVSSQIQNLDRTKTYVVKVDQGVKKRMKNGLIFIDKKVEEIEEYIAALGQKGFSNFLVEPFFKFAKESEKYLMLERVREGVKLIFSENGGIDVEDDSNILKNFIIKKNTNILDISQQTNIPANFLEDLIDKFDTLHFGFLEINPLLIEADRVVPLDCALLVDSAGEFFVDSKWTENDFVVENKSTQEEINVALLDLNTPASLKLSVLNKDGNIGLLLSSGGASIVIADEIASFGLGNKIINYGEYSGGPSREETYKYSQNILNLLLNSKAKKKVLLIAGGVANFTDILETFKGIIDALTEVKDKLNEQKIKVFVRRGGPNEEKGLRSMQNFLEENNLFGNVAGSELSISIAVEQAINQIN